MGRTDRAYCTYYSAEQIHSLHKVHYATSYVLRLPSAVNRRGDTNTYGSFQAFDSSIKETFTCGVFGSTSHSPPSPISFAPLCTLLTRRGLVWLRVHVLLGCAHICRVSGGGPHLFRASFSRASPSSTKSMNLVPSASAKRSRAPTREDR